MDKELDALPAVCGAAEANHLGGVAPKRPRLEAPLLPGLLAEHPPALSSSRSIASSGVAPLTP